MPAALELAVEHAREARAAAGRLVARVAPGRDARRRAEAPGDLRVRRRARRDRQHHRRRAAVLPRGRRRRRASAGTRSRRRWRSTRRSTCASCSATRRSSSATRCTCWPRARSTRGPLITGTVGLDGVDAAFTRARRPRGPREDPDRSALGSRAARRSGTRVAFVALLVSGAPAFLTRQQTRGET